MPAKSSVTAWELPPLADEAYKCWLKGASMRAIARELDLDPATVKRYIEALHKEQLARIRAKRERLLSEAVARLRHVQAEAWGQFGADGGNVAALNTVVAAEREAAKLQGLYDAGADDGGAYGVTITITKRGAVVRQQQQRETAAEANADADED